MKNMIRNLYESLLETRKETLSIISDIEKDDLERKIEDQWSIAQLLKHLAMSELGSIKVVNSLIKKSEKPLPPYPEDESSIDFRNPKQPPGKLICPKVVTPPDFVPVEEALRELEDLRGPTRTTLELLSSVDPTSRTMEHPFFGECNMYEWFSFLLDHERVHQKQIRGIAEKLKGN